MEFSRHTSREVQLTTLNMKHAQNKGKENYNIIIKP